MAPGLIDVLIDDDDIVDLFGGGLNGKERFVKVRKIEKFKNY